jgi:chromosome segregation ATPase
MAVKSASRKSGKTVDQTTIDKLSALISFAQQRNDGQQVQIKGMEAKIAEMAEVIERLEGQVAFLEAKEEILNAIIDELEFMVRQLNEATKKADL